MPTQRSSNVVQRNGAELTVYYLADDAVAAWLPGFLGSLRRHNPSVRVVWIPFSQRVRVASRLAQWAAAEPFTDASYLAAFDALGSSVLGSDVVWARRDRKFVAQVGAAA